MRGRFGQFGKQLRIHDLYESFRDDPELQKKLAEALGEVGGGGGGLQEAGIPGTGSPEGRADFPFFLQTMIRLRIRERFNTVAAKWDQYVGIESAQDFRENRVIQFNGITGIEPVNEFGEYNRMRSAEEPGPPYSVGKHGGIYGISYEMVINDEVDRMLNRIPRELGRASAEYVSRLVVALMESNPNYIDAAPFLSAGRGNERVGATAQPTETNLMQILSLMRLKRDPNGIPFTVEPSSIIVRDDETRMIFKKIKRSQQTGAVTNDPTARQIATGTLNPLFEDDIVPDTIQEPWLNDPDDWWVMANAQDRPAFIAAFLRGQREPFIGVQDDGVRSVNGNALDPYTLDYDVIPFKLRHVLGAAIGEPLAVFRARPG